MSGAIEDIAKKWLAEPAYTKVFKHTADVVEDYICYFLTAIGAIALSVKFLTSLGSGDLSCIIGGKFTEPELVGIGWLIIVWLTNFSFKYHSS